MTHQGDEVVVTDPQSEWFGRTGIVSRSTIYQVQFSVDGGETLTTPVEFKDTQLEDVD